jgi:hypothetical protein
MEQLPKVAISAESDKYLEDMRKSVNEGFSGRVTKGQIAAWSIAEIWANLTQKQIDKIRADHFDEVAHLEHVVKQLKEARKAKAPLAAQDLLAPVLQKQKAATGSRVPKRNTGDETESET